VNAKKLISKYPDLRSTAEQLAHAEDFSNRDIGARDEVPELERVFRRELVLALVLEGLPLTTEVMQRAWDEIIEEVRNVS
jgi:hypothetical protein